VQQKDTAGLMAGKGEMARSELTSVAVMRRLGKPHREQRQTARTQGQPPRATARVIPKGNCKGYPQGQPQGLPLHDAARIVRRAGRRLEARSNVRSREMITALLAAMPVAHRIRLTGRLEQIIAPIIHPAGKPVRYHIYKKKTA
jgi:hypothetical protein